MYIARKRSAAGDSARVPGRQPIYDREQVGRLGQAGRPVRSAGPACLSLCGPSGLLRLGPALSGTSPAARAQTLLSPPAELITLI